MMEGVAHSHLIIISVIKPQLADWSPQGLAIRSCHAFFSRE